MMENISLLDMMRSELEYLSDQVHFYKEFAEALLKRISDMNRRIILLERHGR